MDAEFKVKLGEREWVLRPTLGELKMLQKRIGGLMKVMGKFTDLSITTSDLAAIVYHGGRGFDGQTMPTIDHLEDLIMSEGQAQVLKACADFLVHVTSQGTKSAAVKKDSGTETQPS